MSRFRLIPTTMMVAVLFMAVKMVDVLRGSQALSEQLFIASVQAESGGEAPKAKPAETKEKAPAKEAEKKPAESKEAPHEGAKEAPKEGGKEDAKEVPKEGAHEEAKEGEHGEGEKKEKNPNVSETPGDTVDDHLSAIQIELLQKLSERRDELDRWEKDIQLKENVLAATEKRIDNKIAQIDSMKAEVSNMLAQYNEKEDAKIRSLVKIYENMKPKDAARIFDEVEMPVLLLVIDKMAEKKVAPVLAEMDSKKAKQLTVELAEQRKVDSTKLNKVTSGMQPGAAPAAAVQPPAK